MEEIIDSEEIEHKQFVYAGFMIRFGAFLIDLIILVILRGVSTAVLVQIDFRVFLYYNYFLQAIFLVIGWLYHAGFESSASQATLGKRALGIYVGGPDGERISFMNATGRYFAKIISSIIIFIGYLMIIWDDRHQALHDKLAGTYVIYKYRNV